MTGDLISRLAAEGDEQDTNRKVTGFGGVVPSFERIRAMIARKFDYMIGVNLDAEFIKGNMTPEMGSQFQSALEKASPLCESPIEHIILPWLIGQKYPAFEWNPAVLLPGEGAQLVPFTVAVIPQLPIGRYRADFALASSRRDGKIRFIIVECDGKEFHDGVQNVIKDVDRDVRLLANERVLDVVRFEGREIMRSAQKCAQRAAEAVRWAWSTKNTEVAHKFSRDIESA